MKPWWGQCCCLQWYGLVQIWAIKLHRVTIEGEWNTPDRERLRKITYQ